MTRPRGELRQVLERGLAMGGGSTRELAVRTGVGVSAARETLNNMRRAGEVLVRQVPIPGVRRPVPVYELAAPARQAAMRPELPPRNWDLITCWQQWPA